MRAWGAVAALGHLAWLAGNAHEARTRAIERWAADPPASVLARGSPPRYYAVIVPPTAAATVLALTRSRAHRGRRWAAPVAAASSATAMAITLLLVRTVNLPLFRGEVDALRSSSLIRRWYRLNRVRIGLLCLSVGALLRASRS